MFIETYVLPALTISAVTIIVILSLPLTKYCILVRKDLKASETLDFWRIKYN